MEEAKSAKTEVVYTDAGQTPPNTAGKPSIKVFTVALQVWLTIVVGLWVAYWLFAKSVRERAEVKVSVEAA
ncbi:hypothetical protein [Thiomonas sp.]